MHVRRTTCLYGILSKIDFLAESGCKDTASLDSSKTFSAFFSKKSY